MQDMMHAGYILPTYEQAAISGYGCEPLKAVSGKAEASVTTAGGHVNESNNRIISRRKTKKKQERMIWHFLFNLHEKKHHKI